MDILASLFAIFLTYVVFAIVKWAIQRRHRLKLFERYGIPGPKPSFLTGNLKQLKAESTPNGVITKWLEEYGDVFGYYIGEIPHVIVKDLDMLKQIMIKDFHVFSNREDMFLDVWPLNKTILYLTSKRWKEVRSILTPTFSSGKIKLMTKIIEKKVDITLDIVSKHADNNEMFDMYELVQGLTLDVIADCALAMKTQCQKNSQDMFLVAVRDFFRYAHNRAVEYAIMFPFIKYLMTIISNSMRGGQMTSIIVDNVQTAIEARRKNPNVKSLDILQMMLDHGENEPKGSASRLTDDEVIANAYVFLLAGYETTATALAFTFYLLIKHPEVQQRLHKEIDATDGEDYATVQGLQYLDQVFEESLRCYPPVTGFISRKCGKDYEIGSFTIPKDVVVQAPVWDIQHDPELWPDPYKFDPDRFSSENKLKNQKLGHFPFGIGPRICIGERFAKLEAKLAIFRLLKKFSFEACEKTDDPLPLICPTVIINPANGVYLRAKLRNQKKYLVKTLLRDHMAVAHGEKKYVCEFCDSAHRTRGAFNSHMLVHTGEKPYVCDHCQRPFARRVSLNRHMVLHSGSRPFVCQHCNNAYASKMVLKKHVKDVHAIERPHVCQYCPKAFTQMSLLKIHLRIHTGEKPYQCEHCPAAFAARGTLRHHLLTHTGEKSFVCGHCQKAFALKGSLKLHLYTHTIMKPHVCDRCQKGFTKICLLKKHQRRCGGKKEKVEVKKEPELAQVNTTESDLNNRPIDKQLGIPVVQKVWSVPVIQVSKIQKNLPSFIREHPVQKAHVNTQVGFFNFVNILR